MALPTNIYTRQTAANNVKEDNLDIITNTTPYRTPLISSISQSVANQTYHEWNRDSYRAPNPDNASLDGDDSAASAKAPPQRVGNHCQIFKDVAITSRRSDEVRKFGMKKASQYFVVKAGKELQTDFEASALSRNVAVAATDSVAPKSAGAGMMIYSSASFGATGNVVAHTSGAATAARTDGDDRTIVAGTWYQTVMQSISTKSSVVPDTAFMPAFVKKDTAGIAGLAANRVNQNKTKSKMMEAAIIMGVDVISTGFGDLALVPHYGMEGMDHVLLLNSETMSAAYIDRLQIDELGKTGDNVRYQVLMDCCLEMRNEKANGVIHDIIAV